MNLEQFRKEVNELRKPKAYCPVFTEGKGFLNLCIGISQLAAGCLMRVVYPSAEKWKRISAKHLWMSKEALKQGAKEFFPGALVAAGCILAFRRWKYLPV